MKSLSESASIKMTAFILKNSPQKSETELEEIKYGFHVLFANLFKLPILLIIAYIFGIIKYVFISMLCFGSLRTFASGLHANKSWTCFVGTSGLFLGVPLLSTYTKPSIGLILCLYTINLLLVVLYAPADTEKRPIIRAKTRKRLKLQSILVILIYFALSIFLFLKFRSQYNTYLNIFVFSLTAECILITPFTYKIAKGGYRNYEKYY